MAAITHRLRYETLESRRLATADLIETVAVTVESSVVTGIRAAEIELKYDPRKLELNAEDIQPGDAWKGQASLLSHIDEDAGAVKIFLFAIEPISGTDGPLVDLQFAKSDGVATDAALASLSQMRLNEGAIESLGQLKTTETVSEVKACAPWMAT